MLTSVMVVSGSLCSLMHAVKLVRNICNGTELRTLSDIFRVIDSSIVYQYCFNYRLYIVKWDCCVPYCKTVDGSWWYKRLTQHGDSLLEEQSRSSHGHNEQIQNYQSSGLCLSCDILSQSTLFRKLDLLPSSGKWYLLSFIHQEDLMPNIRPDADHDILLWFRISDNGQSGGRW
jgi:hypothetical protein